MERFVDRIMEKLLSGGWTSEEDKEIVRYGLELNIMRAVISAAMLITALAFGRALEVIVFMLAYPQLRRYCGGFHANTKAACFVLSMVILASVIAASRLLTGRASLYASASMLAAGTALIALLAPVDSEKKPFDDTEKTVFRRRSLLMTAAEAAAAGVLFLLKLYGFVLPVTMAVFITGLLLAVGRLTKRKGAIS